MLNIVDCVGLALCNDIRPAIKRQIRTVGLLSPESVKEVPLYNNSIPSNRILSLRTHRIGKTRMVQRVAYTSVLRPGLAARKTPASKCVAMVHNRFLCETEQLDAETL